MTAKQTFVIVGAGLAGAKAAQTLRHEGFEGRLVLVGAEDERPYERPPLSKDYLRSEAGRERIYVHDESFYADHDIELRLGRTAVDMNASLKEVALDDGERLRYDRLLLAIGAEPRRLAIPGAEVAASARTRGLEVTLVAPDTVPLERVLGREVGGIYRDIHADHGVRMLLGTRVEAFEGDGAVERVRTSDGRHLECDFVVVGIGVQPRMRLAARAGLDIGDGILVDEYLRTTAPDVFAAGDVASARHPFYRERIRVEHWANALRQGPIAARNMLGAGQAFECLPYFFSDQYDVGMEYSGFTRTWDRVVFRGDPAGREFIAFWLAGDRVLAGMNVNVWDVVDPIQRLIRDRAPVDDWRLSDSDVALEQLVPIEGGTAA
jgi:3-phenylpropionate/trans-cinnamate dioxygenase ferredoxin reductase component